MNQTYSKLEASRRSAARCQWLFNRSRSRENVGAVRIAKQACAPRRLAAGSAAVEFISMAPFILALMALVWDLREYISYRTALAREMFVVAELIANETETNPIESLVGRVTGRLAEYGAGTVSVAVVTRGTQRWNGEVCTDDAAWCLPNVVNGWTTSWSSTGSETLTDGGDCADLPAVLPRGMGHFGKGKPVLPSEDQSNSEPNWLSRRMRPQEWWVVIESCLHPAPGRFFGRLPGLGFDLFDASRFIQFKRAAWGSIHDRAHCEWCEP